MITQEQGNPNVILKVNDYAVNELPRDYEANHITPAVNTAYNNGATTVKVVDKNNAQIGAYPRHNPNA